MSEIMKQFPLIKVNTALFISLLPINFIFRFESLTTNISLRWNTNITLFNLDPVDYRRAIFANSFNRSTFGVWSFQILLTLLVVLYHIIVPSHPKYYSTRKNTISIIVHMIGGTTAILGFYIGALANLKPICIIAAVFGLSMHWPTTIWQVRQLQGQREMMVPVYVFMEWLLLQSYIDFFLYNGSYQAVFSCAMTMNTFAMVRFYDFLGARGGMQTSLDRSTVLAGLCNAPFVLGVFAAFIAPIAIFLWNIYFEMFKPMPRASMRIYRGYNDTVPDELELKHGVKFADELDNQIRRKSVANNKREAIARALFRVIAGEDRLIDLKEVSELYESWGLPDAEAAARSTFRRADKDKSGAIDFEEFKDGFKEMIHSVYIKGEYEAGQDAPLIITPKLPRREKPK